MNKRISPAQAARRVLKAFPYAHAGVEVSTRHIADYFRRNGFSASDIVAGTHYASSLGWVEKTDIQSLRLTLEGVRTLEGRHAIVPPSTWHAWAHP